MKYVFWTTIAIFLLIQAILYIREGHIGLFLKSTALERTALVVKPEDITSFQNSRFSFEGDWGQGKQQTYLFLITNPRIRRGEGNISKIGLITIQQGTVQEFEITTQDTLDSALDHHITPPSLLRGMASTLTFNSLLWFHEGEVRNYFAKTLSSHAFGHVPDYVITLPEEEFTKMILPLKAATPKLLTREEFQILQNLVHKKSEEMPIRLTSYDMTFPEKARELREQQTITESALPHGGKRITITATQSSPETFTNFVRIYLPYVTSASTTSQYFFQPIMPEASPNSFVSHPLIIALEDSTVFDTRTRLYTYEEGEYTVVGGFLRVGPTPRTFTITITQDP